MASQQQAVSLAPGLARKVKKVLDIKAEAPDLVEALSTLSLLYHENTPASRRALRSAVEKRGLEISETFITAAETVIQALNGVSNNLEGLSSSCGKIFSTLSEAKASAGQLCSETERLQGLSEVVDVKIQTVSQFLQQYQVSEEEVAALQAEDPSDSFFTALAHVRQIHDNCRTLLRTHHQRAGLELMDMMAVYQETAYERLCRWIQGECRNMGDLDAPDVSSNLQKAVHALQDRPVLFKYCIEEVATARHNALFQRFITALTRGGPGGMPRPIEMHAHDPQRYINDMLAWVHQALADEREFVVALFGIDGSSQSEEDTGMGHGRGDLDQAHGGPGGGEHVSCAALLDRIFDSICRPLRVRIEQVLMTSLPPLLCFQLAQLQSFYLQLMLRVLGPSAQLAQAIRACRDMASRIFMEQMRGKADKLIRSPPAPPHDLSTPPQVVEAVHAMIEVVDVHESAMQASSPASAASQDELRPVMAMLVESLMDACQRSAEALTQEQQGAAGQKLPNPSARYIYLINCLSHAAAAFTQRASAADWAQQLSSATEQFIDALVDGEVRLVLTRVKCLDILDRLQMYQQQKEAGGQTGGEEAGAQQPLPATDASLAHKRIVEAMRSFFTLLSSPDAVQEFKQVQVPRVRTVVSDKFARALAAAYELMYQALEDPLNGYLEQGGASAVRNNPSAVRTILGIS